MTRAVARPRAAAGSRPTGSALMRTRLYPSRRCRTSPLFFFNDTATTEIYTLSLHDALPISPVRPLPVCGRWRRRLCLRVRSEEHTSELQSLRHLVCRLLLEKKKKLTAAVVE